MFLPAGKLHAIKPLQQNSLQGELKGGRFTWGYARTAIQRKTGSELGNPRSIKLTNVLNPVFTNGSSEINGSMLRTVRVECRLCHSMEEGYESAIATFACPASSLSCLPHV
jgi:hypothetical protein